MKITQQLEVTLSVVAYSLCSGSLVLINKLILARLPFPSLVITVQLLAALLFIYSAKALGYLQVDPIQKKFVIPYLAYTIAFSTGVFCNMKSLSISNVETVIVFRAMAPMVVSFLDALFLGREFPSKRSWGALALIVLGAIGYAQSDQSFKSQGWHVYIWPTLYLITISFEMAYGKKIIRSVDLKTRSGPVLYTNLLGWPPMLVFAAMNDEYAPLWEMMWERDTTRFPPGSIPLLLSGCVVGTAIGYGSWWCRGNVSATSFTLIGVMNKCITVLVNLLIWDNHASPTGIAFLFLCLLGGMFYKQAPMSEQMSDTEQILLLRHASKCKAGPSCKTKSCAQTVALWKHMFKCQNKNCKTAHCLSSRRVLKHFRICRAENKSYICKVCAPVMRQMKGPNSHLGEYPMDTLVREQIDSPDPAEPSHSHHGSISSMCSQDAPDTAAV